jgi:predicted transcriptional regulator
MHAIGGRRMGKCIYVAEAPTRGGKMKPVVQAIPSEVWMNPAEAGRVLAEGHLLNTTVGVWLYESDLLDKDELRARLLALVDHVTTPGFLMKRRKVTQPRADKAHREVDAAIEEGRRDYRKGRFKGPFRSSREMRAALRRKGS